MSLLDGTCVGSSVALRSFSRLGSSLSVLDCSHLGSSLALRSFARLGSTLSLFGMARLGASLSVLDVMPLGSSVSLRSFSRFGSALSVLDFTNLGSSLSLRSCGRLASTMSLFGLTRLGSSLSLMDFVHLGSSLSLRQFARVGASLSILSSVHLGSSLSIRGIIKNAQTLSLYGRMHFGSSESYMVPAANSIKAFGNKLGSGIFSLTINDEPGGVLHGTWYSDVDVGTSDRRLKTNIQPLEKTLHERDSSEALRDLRPVSYNYKGSGKDAKNLRFGFIADEMKKTLPEITRTLPQHDDQKLGIVYQDLLAFLVATLQGLSKEMSVLMPRLATVEERIRKRKKRKRARRRAAKKAAGSVGAPAVHASQQTAGATVTV